MTPPPTDKFGCSGGGDQTRGFGSPGKTLRQFCSEPPLSPPKPSKTPGFAPKYTIIAKIFACGAHAATNPYVSFGTSRYPEIPRSFRRGGSNPWYSTDIHRSNTYRITYDTARLQPLWEPFPLQFQIVSNTKSVRTSNLLRAVSHKTLTTADN